jgi:hypothetical protein
MFACHLGRRGHKEFRHLDAEGAEERYRMEPVELLTAGIHVLCEALIAVEATPEVLPERFENYELVKRQDGKPVQLGRGAMGVTYKAIDVDLQCALTLKVISARYLGMNLLGFVFYAKPGRLPAFAIQTLPPCYIWAELRAVTSTRWSL